MEFNKKELECKLDPQGLRQLKNAFEHLTCTQYSSCGSLARDHLTNSEKEEYDAMISAFDQKRRETAMNELYIAAKNFVALYETRD